MEGRKAGRRKKWMEEVKKEGGRERGREGRKELRNIYLKSHETKTITYFAWSSSNLTDASGNATSSSSSTLMMSC